MMRLLHYNGFKHSAYLCLAMMISLSGFGQKLPFQGKLLENDELVNGTKSFTFNIASRGWTEEHPDISVLDGYYSVVLGEITPLPGDLFQGVDSETMTITVDGQSLGEVLLYKPVGGSSAFKDQDSQVSETIAAFEAEVTGTGVWGDQNTQYAGVFGKGNALNGGNAGVRGEAEAAAGNTGFNYGVYGLSFSSVPDATGYGVRGEVGGTYDFGVGVRGIGANTQLPTDDLINNYGGFFSANGNAFGNTGVYGRANDGNTPGALNIGVYGQATGTNPGNFAGFFEGNVNVTGDLNVQGNFDFSIESVDIFNYDNNGQIFGGINLRGDATETQVNDNIRNSLEVTRTTNGKSVGALRIRGPVDGGDGFPAGLVNLDIQDDPRDLEGMAGGIFLDASEGGAPPIPNIYMGGKAWENSNLPYFNMFGSHEDGGSWYHLGLNLQINENENEQWGTFELYRTTPGLGNALQTVRIDGQNGNLNINGGNNRSINFGTVDSGIDPVVGGTLPYFFMFGDDVGDAKIDFRIQDGGLGDYGRISINGPNDANITLFGEDGSGNFSGDVTSPNINQLSDRNLKENIQPLNKTLSKVLTLRGVSYDWKDDKYGSETEIGVIAQEVEEVFPQFVNTGKEGIKSVNYAQMVAVLIEAIKEMNGNIETLESKVAALEEDKSILEKEKADLARVWSEIDQLKKLLKVGSVSTSQQ